MRERQLVSGLDEELPETGQDKETAHLAQAVAKAIDIIELVGSRREMSIGDLATHMKLPRPTLHRLITALIHEGYLQRVRHGYYGLSVKLWRIGTAVALSDTLRESAHLTLYRLVKETSESAHYALYDGGFAVYLDKIDGIYPISTYTTIGTRSPGYASATGKSLLAWQTDAEIARVVAEAKAHTSKTLVDPTKLTAELDEVRRNGYSISKGEWTEDVWGVAAAVFGPRGNALGAIGISGPAERFRAKIDSYANIVMSAARELSQADGWRDS